MSKFLTEMEQWCKKLLNVYEKSFNEIKSHVRNETLERWKSELLQLHDDIVKSSSINEFEIEQRANALYEQFLSFFETEENRLDWGNRSVPIGGHKLPPLPYAYDALEPYIDRETMRLHHDKHHQSYVDGLNRAERELENARRTNDFSLIKHWERELAFHGAGHYLHTIFWSVMSPDGGGTPTGEIRNEINRSFGSFAAFKSQFSEAANNVEGGGWAILVWSPRARRLEILTAEKHQNLSQWDIVPLLVLDVWEHAYYLKYKNERKKYVENWWNIVNWREVENRYEKARHLKWEPF